MTRFCAPLTAESSSESSDPNPHARGTYWAHNIEVSKKKARYEVCFVLTPRCCVLQFADFYTLLPPMSPLSLFDRRYLSPEIIGSDEGLPRFPVRRRSGGLQYGRRRTSFST